MVRSSHDVENPDLSGRILKYLMIVQADYVEIFMEQELKADSLFQVLLKSFYTVFGIENLSQINTELKEIL
ncbi:hypothetical protein H8E77_31615, partial [bacterium]|nr:hypothetical protein [bacterium]